MTTPAKENEQLVIGFFETLSAGDSFRGKPGSQLLRACSQKQTSADSSRFLRSKPC